MNIVEALKSGKPFAYPEMIGAYCLVEGTWLDHRDNVFDFRDMDYILRTVCRGNFGYLCALDVLREDWFLVDLDMGKEVLK